MVPHLHDPASIGNRVPVAQLVEHRAVTREVVSCLILLVIAVVGGIATVPPWEKLKIGQEQPFPQH